MRYVAKCAAITLIGLTTLTGCTGQYGSSFGRYEGEVRPITTPVELRYGPMPRTEGTMQIDMTVRAENRSQSLRIAANSAFSIAKMGERLLAAYGIDRLTLNGREVDQGLRAGQILMNERGEIVEASYEVDGQPIDPTDSERFSEAETVARQYFPVLPAEPVISGSILHVEDGQSMSILGSIPGGSVAGTDGPAMSQVMAVRGMTTYQGREAVVMDVTLSGSVEQEGTLSAVNAQGFHLIDAQSGAFLRSELVFTMSLPIGGKDGSISAGMSYRADLP